MVDPRYAQEMQTMRNRVGSPAPGMGSPQVSPPPQGAPQQPLAGGQPQMAQEETPGFRQQIEQVEDTLVQGKQGDLMIFGEFIARMEGMARGHQQGAGAPPAGGAPAMGGQPPPMM